MRRDEDPNRPDAAEAGDEAAPARPETGDEEADDQEAMEPDLGSAG